MSLSEMPFDQYSWVEIIKRGIFGYRQKEIFENNNKFMTTNPLHLDPTALITDDTERL